MTTKPIRERFPPPWRVEEVPGGYRFNDASGTALAYVYAGPQGLTRPSPGHRQGDR